MFYKPTEKLVSLFLDAFVSGFLFLLTIYLIMSQSFWWIAAAIFSVIFIISALSKILKFNGFVEASGIMLVTLSDILFDSEQETDKFLTELNNNKIWQGKATKDIIRTAAYKVIGSRTDKVE
jgi:hypothetical protein